MLGMNRVLPGLDGLARVQTPRAVETKTPALLVTGPCGADERMAGLEAAGDAYPERPLALLDLDARWNARARCPPLAEPRTTLPVAARAGRFSRRRPARGDRGAKPARHLENLRGVLAARDPHRRNARQPLSFQDRPGRGP